MKFALTSGAIFLAVAALVILGHHRISSRLTALGDRLIASRFTVARYTYMPANSPREITEEIIVAGMRASLQRAEMNPNTWAVAPVSEWQPPDALMRTNAGLPSILIILSNRTDGTRLYARVESADVTNGIQYHLYHPK
jgi:hypothetical protein